MARRFSSETHFGRRANRERLSCYPVLFDTRKTSAWNQQNHRKPALRIDSRERLLQKMSEVISLREKVAQAELAAHLYSLTPGQSREEPKE
jgi:hypothetical protein